MIVLYCVFLCVAHCVYATFDTLGNLVAYAEKNTETPSLTYNDWRDPDYTDFLYAQTPGFFQKLWQRFTGKPLWSAEEFKDAIIRGTQRRARVPQGSLVFLKVPAGSKLYIWGDLHGAFHSLVRELAYLEKQGVINHNLEIVQKNAYFFFVGDAINRSAYTMETLTVLARLLEKNPEHVFYLKGTHESFGYWQNFSLDRELRIRAAHIATQEISADISPLQTEVNAFLATLPLAAYVMISGDEGEVLRISHKDREESGIDEDHFGAIDGVSINDGVTIVPFPEKAPSEKPLNVAAIVRGEARTETIKGAAGLDQLDPERGTTMWSTLSASTPLYREYFKFYADAFSCVTLGNTLEESTIALVTRDVREASDFVTTKTFELVSGQLVTDVSRNKEKKKTLIFGSTLSLTHNVRLLGQRVKRGISAVLNEQNSEGGVDGHPLRVTFLNDEYIPRQARKNIEFFLKRGIDTIIIPVGTPTFEAYSDLVKDFRVGVFFPQGGGSIFQNAEFKGLINLRASLADEARALVKYMYEEHESRVFTFFYQNDSYGRGALEEAHAALKELGIEKWTDVAYMRGQLVLNDQAKAIMDSRPDTIMFFSTGAVTQELLRIIPLQRIVGSELCVLSPLNESSFRAFVKSIGLKLTYGQVMPDPRRSELEIVREYRKAMDTAGFGYDTPSLEGYVAGALFIELLKRAAGNFSKEHIMSLAEQLVDTNFKGLELSFDSATRSLAKYVWIEPVDGAEWIQVPIARLSAQNAEEKSDLKEDLVQAQLPAVG